MNTHKELYRKILRLLPNLDDIPISKEPLLLEKEGKVPLNVHVLERQAGITILNLSRYPRNGHGELVPDPDVEIRLDSIKKEAMPTVYIGQGDRVELDEADRKRQPEEARQLDRAVNSWLVRLEKQGFNAVGQEGGR